MRWRCALWLLVALAFASAGCANHQMYYWSSYQKEVADSGLSSRHFERTLKSIIQHCDASGRKVPPGLLAEYGYIQLMRGEVESAIGYLEREAREWPESAFFMERMIETARQGARS